MNESDAMKRCRSCLRQLGQLFDSMSEIIEVQQWALWDFAGVAIGGQQWPLGIAGCSSDKDHTPGANSSFVNGLKGSSKGHHETTRLTS